MISLNSAHCNASEQLTDFSVVFEKLEAYEMEQAGSGYPSQTIDDEELEAIRLLSRIAEETASPQPGYFTLT